MREGIRIEADFCVDDPDGELSSYLYELDVFDVTDIHISTRYGFAVCFWDDDVERLAHCIDDLPEHLRKKASVLLSALQKSENETLVFFETNWCFRT